MSDLGWILVGGFLMAAIAMVGSVTIVLRPATLQRLLLPLVAMAAGTLLGGAFFHMIPEATGAIDPLEAATWVVAGFTTFLAMEQFLHWHRSHGDAADAPDAPEPVTYLILFGDAAHNLLGGIGVASTFLLDARAGTIAWFAAAAHEVPQELGDFGILVHGGWSRSRALLWNFVSALTFPLGAVLAYVASMRFELHGLVLFAAGNFLYIAASDLVPEIKAAASLRRSLVHCACFVAGLLLMLGLAYGLRD